MQNQPQCQICNYDGERGMRRSIAKVEGSQWHYFDTDLEPNEEHLGIVLELEQAQASKQENMKGIVLKVNSSINKEVFGKVYQYIMRKLMKEMKDQMDVGEQFIVILFLVIRFALSSFTSILLCR